MKNNSNIDHLADAIVKLEAAKRYADSTPAMVSQLIDLALEDIRTAARHKIAETSAKSEVMALIPGVEF